MARANVKNGNGYQCDICGTLLEPHNVFKIRCEKTLGHTGYMKTVDVIGVCEECYRKEFQKLCGRGLLRTRIKDKKVGVKE